MDAALRFRLAGPSARPWVGALGDPAGAGHAANGLEPVCHKWVGRQVFCQKRLLDVVSCPVSKGIDLDEIRVSFDR